MNKLFYTSDAKDFFSALLLGNGRLGVTVYGGVNEDVYALNDDTLWSGYPKDNVTDCKEHFEKAKELVLEGRISEAESLIVSNISGSWSQCYLPAGNLVIKGDYGDIHDYKRELSLDSALHTVEFDGYTREAFTSYPDDVLCIRYNGKALPALDISLSGILKPSVYTKNGLLFLEGEAPGDGIPSYIKAEEYHIYSEEPQKRGMRYGIGVSAKTDGEVSYLSDSIKVKNATWLEVYLTIKTSFAGHKRHPFLDGADYKTELEKILSRVSKYTYSEIKARHIADYSALFSRVTFEIDGGRDDLPTDIRLTEHNKTPDPSLYALIYQFGRYLTIASSRKGTEPTNLQGIWNVLPAPPWSCNYTTNINTQMNYWGTLGANLAECCEPLNRFIYELSKEGMDTAKKVFGADGFCINHNTDIWRMTHPVGNWNSSSMRYGYFPLAGAWLTRHLYEYYIDTKDTAFLNGPAFDAIMGSARFCDSMLSEVDGALVFAPATSPENIYIKGGKSVALCKSSAMYQSIVRDAFEICIETCDITGRETDYARYLEQRLENIPWLESGTDGRVLEWENEKEEADKKHRHISHLYSFYPAKKIKDKDKLQALKNSLETRGDEGTGWSCVWKVCLWAMLGDGERAISLFDMLMRVCTQTKTGNVGGGMYENLLCACPPFQIDGNFGIIAAVNEMLVQEKDGDVLLLPALPKLWKSGRVSGIRINSKTVSIEWKNGKVISFTQK